jgi:hypothetical protein
MANKIKSRNDLPRYTYFFVVSNNKRTLSRLPFPEFNVYKFESPVTEARGKVQLNNEYVTSVTVLTDDEYAKNTFTHPNYRNQKNEHVKFKYTEVPVIGVEVKDSKSIGLETTIPVDYESLIKRSKNEFFG